MCGRLGMSKDKIYYLFNAEQRKDDSKQHKKVIVDHRNIATNTHKKVLDEVPEYVFSFLS